MSCLLKKSLFSRELVALGQLTRSFVVAGPFPTKPAYDPKFGWQISISPNKKVCVRKWQDTILIDIRNYWDPNGDGNMVPTKKGISLTEQQWESFLSHRLDIEKLLDLVKTDKTASKVPEQEEVK
ncbi:hypothetical protein WA556_000227, partial [Blastocystis sp. ATCC 50177/Nand II]